MGYPRRSIPSVSGLIAFEATARHLSFSRAAEELSLTQGAVSKRVRQLEDVLGFQLFVRNTNQVCLTDVGQKYLRDAAELIRQLHNSTESIRAAARGVEAVKVAAPSAFAIRWLVPRLRGFSNAFPNCLIDIVSICSSEDTRAADADCVVFEEQIPWREAHLTTLASGTYIAVAAAGFLSDPDMLSHRDLLECPLLAYNGTPDLWQRWFSSAGLNEPPLETMRFDDLTVLIEATLAGHGIALLPDFLVSRDILNGRLQHLFPESQAGHTQYRLAVHPGHRRSSVQAFAGWLGGAERNRNLSDRVRLAL